MCLNCGCKMPTDKMGDDRNITVEDLAKAQMANEGLTGEQTIQNMKESLEMIKGADIDEEVEKIKSRSQQQ